MTLRATAREDGGDLVDLASRSRLAFRLHLSHTICGDLNHAPALMRAVLAHLQMDQMHGARPGAAVQNVVARGMELLEDLGSLAQRIDAHERDARAVGVSTRPRALRGDGAGAASSARKVDDDATDVAATTAPTARADFAEALKCGAVFGLGYASCLDGRTAYAVGALSQWCAAAPVAMAVTLCIDAVQVPRTLAGVAFERAMSLLLRHGDRPAQRSVTALVVQCACAAYGLQAAPGSLTTLVCAFAVFM